MRRLSILAIFLLALTIPIRESVATTVGRTAGQFAVSASGSAGYAIPIWAPPGPNKLQPHISLTYDSRQGDGYLGVGWTIAGLSSIYRCNRTFAQDGAPSPVSLAYTDAFCLDGKRLRLTSSETLSTYGQTGTTYQTEIADFSNITANGALGNGPSNFTVQSRDGLIYTYGTVGGTQDHATVSVTPGGSSTTSASQWLLSKVQDRAGNIMTISYCAAGSSDTNCPTTEPTGTAVPDTISWTPTTHGSSTFAYTMTFQYAANVAASSTTGFVANAAVSNFSLLTSIRINYQGSVIKDYILGYTASPTTGRNELTQLQECADTAGTNCLLPTQFQYLPGTLGLSAAATTILSTTTGIANVSTKYDFNGDGYPDIVYSDKNNNWYVILGSASGFGAPISTGINGLAVPVGPQSPACPSCIAIGDIFGSGKAGILAKSGSTFYYYTLSGSTFTGVNTSVPYDSAGNQFVLADIDGDGRSDLVEVSAPAAGGALVITTRLSTSTGSSPTFSTTAVTALTLSSIPYNYGWLSSLSAPNTQSNVPLDLNGDGRADFMLLASGFLNGHYSLNYYNLLAQTGGTFAAVVGSVFGQVANWDNDQCADFVGLNSIQIGGCTGGVAQTITVPNAGSYIPMATLDYDGDGRNDLLMTGSGSTLNVYLSTGNGIAAVQSTPVNPTTALTSATSETCTGTDVNADGLDDLVCSLTNGTTSVLAYYLHNGAGAPPDLLSKVTDGYGNTSSPTYVSIKQGSYTPSTDAVYPYKNYVGPLYVVSKVTYSDPSSATPATYSISYTYAGAWLNLQGRGFTGFKSMSSVDSRTVALAPSNGLSETHYYERAFPFTGLLYQDVVSNGTFSLSSSTGTPSCTPFPGCTPPALDSTANNQRYFPYFTNWTTTTREFGGSENSDLITTASTTYSTPDNYGNYTTVTQVVTDNDPGSPYGGDSWTTVTNNVFNSPDTTNWCVGLLGSQQIAYSSTDGGLPVTRTKTFTPDSDPTKCRYHQVVTEPSSSIYMATEILGYDSFGNVNSDQITGIGMPQRTTGVTWSATGQFPQIVTNALSQNTQSIYDPKWGKVATVTDPNGIEEQKTYDSAFGRLSKETAANGTYTQWTYTDCAGTGGCLFGSHAMVKAHTAYNSDGTVLSDGTTYSDTVGRAIVTTQRGLAPGSYTRNAVRYDSLGNVSYQAVPCAWSGLSATCPSGTTFTHDVLNRLTKSQLSGFAATQYNYAGRSIVTIDPNLHSKTTVTDVNGRLRRTTDANNYAVTLAYDAAGGHTGTSDNQQRTLWTGTVQYGIAPFTVTTSDLAMGAGTYTFDALGELTQWSDANGHTFKEYYDSLSRPTSRKEPDLFTQWTWGSTAASYNIGQLASVCTGTGTNPTVCSASGYSESETYESAGRLSQRSITIPAGTFTYGYTYNSSGLPSILKFPATGFGNPLQIQYGYSNGHLQSIEDISDPPSATTIWTANASNPSGQLTQETLGNGVVINRSFDAVAQWLNSVTAGIGGSAALENQSYLHDAVGNVTQRQENNLGLTENFYYDNLNRLFYSQLGSQQSGFTTNLQMCYDNTAGSCTENLEGMGTVTSKTADAITPVSYTATWTSYNYPASISGATESVQFAYGPDRKRWQQNYNSGAEITNYIGAQLEQLVTSSGTSYRHYIYAGAEPVAVQSRTSSGNTWTYMLSDHQGSVAGLLNSSGGVDVNESFTAFGARRNPATWSGVPTNGDLTTIAGFTRQGYTFQTALGQSMGLNHMNGRVQDAITGQFLSPDPNIQDPSNTQYYNRYSYAINNPLTLTDPTGFDNSNTNYNPLDCTSPGRPNNAAPCTSVRDFINSQGAGAGTAYLSSYAPAGSTSSGVQARNSGGSQNSAGGIVGCIYVLTTACGGAQTAQSDPDAAPQWGVPMNLIGPNPSLFAPGTFLGNLAAAGSLYQDSGVNQLILGVSLLPAGLALAPAVSETAFGAAMGESLSTAGRTLQKTGLATALSTFMETTPTALEYISTHIDKGVEVVETWAGDVEPGLEQEGATALAQLKAFLNKIYTHE